MKIAIIGAGLTGLTAAFKLGQKDHQIIIFEKEKSPGGLCATFKNKNWSWPLEYYPHHLFTSDKQAKKLIKQLNLEKKLFFAQPKTSILSQGQIFQFDSPLSVLSAPLFSWREKTRIALVTLYLKTTSSWKNLEKEPAATWLKKQYGQKAYQILWEPLLKGKFGQESEKIAMSWFWSRIKKRSAQLGYLEGSFQTLTNTLVKQIKKSGNKIICNHEIKNLKTLQDKFSKVIITTSSKTFLKLAPNLPKDYQKQLENLKIIGSACLSLALKKPFLVDNTYWLNINEKKFPFVFVDQHTNFVKSKFYANNHLLYVGGYYPKSHRYFKIKKEKILKEFTPFLKRINPRFKTPHITSYMLHRNLYSQPIVPINYSKMIPSHKTPLNKVYLANMQQIYPWDRGINYAIDLGIKISKIIENEKE